VIYKINGKKKHHPQSQEEIKTFSQDEEASCNQKSDVGEKSSWKQEEIKLQ